VTAKRASKTPKSTKVFGRRQEPAKMFRAGLYAQVSTHDQQTLPLQMRAMREYAAKRGWEIAVQVKEVGSGAVGRELREKLMAAARRGEIDTALVWRLDRWGRSLADLVVTLKGTRPNSASGSCRSPSAGPYDTDTSRNGWPALGIRGA
jgi:DNA invertase Pin-like site-specific DNA recombinase